MNGLVDRGDLATAAIRTVATRRPRASSLSRCAPREAVTIPADPPAGQILNPPLVRRCGGDSACEAASRPRDYIGVCRRRDGAGPWNGRPDRRDPPAGARAACRRRRAKRHVVPEGQNPIQGHATSHGQPPFDGDRASLVGLCYEDSHQFCHRCCYPECRRDFVACSRPEQLNGPR